MQGRGGGMVTLNQSKEEKERKTEQRLSEDSVK